MKNHRQRQVEGSDEERGVRKRFREKGIYILPNLFTTANLFCGFYAIVAAFNADYVTASMVVLLAMVFDTLDGKVARLTHSTSRFGVEYDSLSDLVSFGVAPGVLIYLWALNGYGKLGWLAVFLFVACGAMRLARFNVQSVTTESKYFVGLPIPAAAGTLVATIIFDHHILGMGKEVRPLVILVLTYILAYLMVSNIRYRSIKEFNLRERKPLSFLVGAVLVLLVFVAAPQIMFFLFFVLYALSGIVEQFLLPLLRPRPALSRKAVKAGANQESDTTE
jgi:CDP-diacylglycerol--serine O-phosphatidyltransferase